MSVIVPISNAFFTSFAIMKGHSNFHGACRQGSSDSILLLTAISRIFRSLNPATFLTDQWQQHYPELALGRVSYLPAGVALFNVIVGNLAKRKERNSIIKKLDRSAVFGPIPSKFSRTVEALDLAATPKSLGPLPPSASDWQEIKNNPLSKLARIGKAIEYHMTDLMTVACCVSYVAMIALGFTLTGGIGLAGVAMAFAARYGYLPNSLLFPLAMFFGSASLLATGGLLSIPGVLLLLMQINEFSAFLDHYQWFRSRLPEWVGNPTKGAHKFEGDLTYDERTAYDLNPSSIYAETEDQPIHEDLKKWRGELLDKLLDKQFSEQKLPQEDLDNAKAYVHGYFWSHYQTRVGDQIRESPGWSLVKRFSDASYIRKPNPFVEGWGDTGFQLGTVQSGLNPWVILALFGMHPKDLREKFFNEYTAEKIVERISQTQSLSEEQAKTQLVALGVLRPDPHPFVQTLHRIKTASDNDQT